MSGNEGRWEVKKLESDKTAETSELLPSLASSEIAAIQIKQFLGRKALDIILANISRQNINWYENKEHQQGRIGINATGFAHEADGKKKYLDLTSEAAKARDEIFEGTQSPIDKIVELFSVDGRKVSIATEEGMNDAPYFAGLIRAMGAKSTLHFDYAQAQLPGWSVSETDEQFGLVLYLQMPTKGGELNIYNRPWQPEDDSHNNDLGGQKGTHGFTEAFIADTPYATVSPEAGDLVVFKTRNFHQVAGIDSDRPRLGLTTFMSSKGDDLLLWS